MLHPFTQDLVTVVEVDDLARLEVNDAILQCIEPSSFATSALGGIYITMKSNRFG